MAIYNINYLNEGFFNKEKQKYLWKMPKKLEIFLRKF